VITEGTITFVVDGEDRVVEAGDTYVIPAASRTRRATTATRKSSATTSSPAAGEPGLAGVSRGRVVDDGSMSGRRRNYL